MGANDSVVSKQRVECDAETYVWRLAGRRVTLQTRYFLRMVPQCVTSTFRPGKMMEASKKISMKNMKMMEDAELLQRLNPPRLTPKIKHLKPRRHPQCHKSTTAPNTTTHIPLISLVNLTLWESARGRGCSSMLWMSRTSHMNWITGWAL